MKILMINKFLYPRGGAETYVLRLGSYLGSIGHEVQYFGMESPGRCVGNLMGSYTKEVDFHNTSLVQRITYPFRIIYSLDAYSKLSALLNRFSPDFVLLNNFNYQLTPSVLYSLHGYRQKTNKKMPVYYIAHDPQLICPNHMMMNPNTGKICQECVGRNYRHCLHNRCIHGSALRSMIGMLECWLYKRLKTYKMLDAIICPSAFIKGIMDTDPDLRGKTIVLHNFFDADISSTAEKRNYVLYFGRYSPEKGLGTLLQAARMLPDINFVFAGAGPLNDRISDTDNIKNVGFKSGQELSDLIAGARLSVYPSEWYENCPFSVLESISLGTPVLGADIGGIPELIEPGITGELFRSGDVEDLVQKLTSLYSNAEHLKSMSLNCKTNRLGLGLTDYCNEIFEQYENCYV